MRLASRRMTVAAILSASLLPLFCETASADPCGMVPPIYLGPGVPSAEQTSDAIGRRMESFPSTKVALG